MSHIYVTTDFTSDDVYSGESYRDALVAVGGHLLRHELTEFPDGESVQNVFKESMKRHGDFDHLFDPRFTISDIELLRYFNDENGLHAAVLKVELEEIKEPADYEAVL